MKYDVDEPLLRFAITNLDSAKDYVDRLPSDELLSSAVKKMQLAIEFLQEWAQQNGIELREGMKT